MSIYNSVVKQVTRLNDIRDEQAASTLSSNPASSSSAPAPPEPNRVDTIIADVFGLLSLFFLTIGKSRETPATYSQIASMRVGRLPHYPLAVYLPEQMLSVMNETGAYTEAFLEPFRERLENLKQIIKQDSADGKHPEPIVRLMMKKLEAVGTFIRVKRCFRVLLIPERQLNDLFASLSVISIELVPIHQRLVAIRKQLAQMSAEDKPNKQEYKAILEELRKIDSKRVDGKFLGPGGVSVPEGQALLSGMLESCFDVAQDIKAREAEGEVSPTVKPIYDRLAQIKAELDRLCRSRSSFLSFLRVVADSSADTSLDTARDRLVQLLHVPARD